MRKFIVPERDQMLLMAYVNLNSAAPMGSAVRVIDEMVDELDTSEIENTYDLESIVGKNPIHPKTIIKVALYALHNCRFSLRKMEIDLEGNLAYRWLTGSKVIDHSTIGKFLVRFRAFIEEIFTQTVIISYDRELLDFEILAIDSMKIRANASHKQDKNQRGLEKEEKKVKKRIKEFLDKVEKEVDDNNEIDALKRREEKLLSAKKLLADRIRDKCKGLKTNKEKIEAQEKINVTDPDAHKMQQANGEINPSYSITTAVDTKSDIITHFQVNEEDNDNRALIPAIEGSIEKTGMKHKCVDADSGFFSMGNIEILMGLKQDSLIPDKRFDVDESGNHSKGMYDRFYFKYIEDEDIYLCPRGHRLRNSASFYNNTGRLCYRYENLPACKDCIDKKECTKGKCRTITRDANEKIKEEMRDKLRIPENKEIYKMRAHAAESPYGNIKHNLKFRTFMRRGRERVKVEIGLLCMLHNIMKIARYAE